MGYLYSSALHVTSESIRDLAEETGMPVGCHGWLELYEGLLAVSAAPPRIAYNVVL